MSKTIYVMTISSEDKNNLENIARDIDSDFIENTNRTYISQWLVK